MRSSLLLLVTLLTAGLLAASEPWTKESLLAYAQDHASALVSAKTSLQNAQDKVALSAPYWQSSVSASLGASSNPSGLSVSPGISSSWKPLDLLGVDLSYDEGQGLRAGVSLRPFTNTSSQASAQQALDLETLRFENARQSLVKSTLTSWASWVRAYLALDIATRDRNLKSEALEAEQIRYDAGKSSETVIGAARIALLDSDRSLWSQKANEKSARDALLLAVGYTEDDFEEQVLAPPVLANAGDLLAKAKSLLAAATPVREGFDLAMARVKLDQAVADATVWPSVLAGLAASGNWSSKQGNWSASVNYSLSFSTLVDPQEKTLAQAVVDAKTSLRSTELKAKSDSLLALYALQGAVSQLELAQRQLLPAQAALDAQAIKSTAGSSTAQKLKDLEINVLRAQSSVASAQADLEAQLLNW